MRSVQVREYIIDDEEKLKQFILDNIWRRPVITVISTEVVAKRDGKIFWIDRVREYSRPSVPYYIPAA